MAEMITCPQCNGKKKKRYGDGVLRDCYYCGGTGKVEKPIQNRYL